MFILTVLLLVHALEFEHDPGQCLDECWRVLDGCRAIAGGCAKPQRPLGQGRAHALWAWSPLFRPPASPAIAADMDLSRAKPADIAFMPPLAGPFFQRFAPAIERIGSRWWPAMGGVLLVEADKMLYAPSGKASRLQAP